MPSGRSSDPRASRGAHGKINASGFGHSVSSPQHDIDVAIAQAAQDCLRRQIAVERIAGNKTAPKTYALYTIAKGTCRDLGYNKTQTMSPNVRRILTACMGKDGPAILERANDAAKIGNHTDWRHDPTLLPKKPPPRRRDPDE